MSCRHCGAPLEHVFLDLGCAPPSNAYLVEAELRGPEVYFPLEVLVCHECWLVQTRDYTRAEALFRPDYAYFSSTSSSWLAHAARFSAMIRRRLGLGPDSFVIEVASNDGYLLQNFVAAGIPCLGIEPTAGTAAAAEKKGIPVRREFFGAALGRALAAEGRQADLIIGNNVYAHVPDINDFTLGLQEALVPGGTLTLEFPHLLRLIRHTQFDTIYHEHFSYLSLYTVERIFAAHGLRIWDVESLPTHGGSLRVYGIHRDDRREQMPGVAEILREETAAGLRQLPVYRGFQARAERVKDELLGFLLAEKRAGRTVAAYGAAAKGNTLLNFAGIKRDLLPFVVDRSPAKQDKYLPGSRLPIVAEARLQQTKPDYVLILPWNLEAEIKAQLAYVRDWGGRFVTAVPQLEIQ